MNLVLLSEISLENQLKMAESIFSKIPNREVRERNKHQKPLDSHAGRILIFKNKTPHIIITWQSPTLKEMSREKPQLLIKYLLTHTGKGSLDYFFKGLGLATSITITTEDFLDYIMYYLIIMITPEGAKKTSEIVSGVYRYILKLRDMSPTQYNSYWIEHSKVLNIKFNYVNKNGPSETVQ